MTESNGTTVMAQGRIVWTSGDLFQGRPKVDRTTGQPRLGKDGKQQIEYGFGLAIPKASVGPGGPNEALWTAMHREALAMLPGAQVIPPAFAMKYKDGDGIDDKGVPFAQRTGYAQHLVIACTTTIPVKYFKHDPASNQNFQIESGIKCGDFIEVQIQVKAHPAQGTSRAGLYINPLAARLLGYGEAIINTPSGDQIFGTSAPVPPQGASATPIGTGAGNLLVPSMASTGTPQYGAPPAFPQAPSVPSSPAPAPHYGVMPQGFQQPAPVPQAPPAMPPMGNPQAYAQPAAQPPINQFAPPVGAPPAYPSNPAMPAMPPVPGMPQY